MTLWMAAHMEYLPSNYPNRASFGWIALSWYTCLCTSKWCQTSQSHFKHNLLWLSQPLEASIHKYLELFHQGEVLVIDIISCQTYQLCLFAAVGKTKEKQSGEKIPFLYDTKKPQLFLISATTHHLKGGLFWANASSLFLIYLQNTFYSMHSILHPLNSTSMTSYLHSQTPPASHFPMK